MERFQLASWTAKNLGIDEHMQDRPYKERCWGTRLQIVGL